MAGGLRRLSARDDEVGREAMAFTLTKPVDLDTLTAELADALGQTPGIVTKGDPSQASEENPVVFWAMGGVETNDLKKVVTKHKVAEPPNAERPSFLDKAEDEPFTPEEIEQALRYLLRRGSA